MAKTKRNLLAMLLILCTAAVFTLTPLFAEAADGSGIEPYTRGRRVNTYNLESVSDRNVNSYSQHAIALNWNLSGIYGRMINREIYVPIQDFAATYASGSVASYNAGARVFTMNGAGYSLSVSDGAYALYINGRTLFAKTPSRVLSDGKMYVPASVISRAFSLSHSVSSYGTLLLSGTPRAAKNGSEYYDSDTVYWLSRIISSESKGESLIGQIAVGNVVLNRVRSADFPNTVWSVIFDRKYGVQFSPVSNGTIYEEPTSTATLAAKICLEGFSVSDDVLYFLRPSASTSSWIVNNRDFLFVIGNHYFFA